MSLSLISTSGFYSVCFKLILIFIGYHCYTSSSRLLHPKYALSENYSNKFIGYKCVASSKQLICFIYY